MTLISTTIPSLISGVSQQAPSYKLSTQADEQINGISSIVDGLAKRPPTEHKSVLNTNGVTLDNSTFFHHLKYSDEEYYTLVVTPSDVFIYDEDGVSRTITTETPQALNYLTGLTSPKTELRATTIADNTALINTTKVVAKDPALSPVRLPEALVYIKYGDYKTKYTIDITYDGQLYKTEYTTRDSSHHKHEVDVQTGGVAKEMVGSATKVMVETAGSGTEIILTETVDNVGRGLLKTGFLPSHIQVELYGNVIRIWSNDATKDFNIETSDDRGDANIYSFKGQTSDFKKLPPKGPIDFKIKVIGNNEREQDDYYVSLQDPDGNGTFVWKETIADGSQFKLDETTMPHVFVKEPSGVFHFKPLDWEDRVAGDDDTNPFPSFVGNTISDVFFYRNRLGFLSAENVIMSEVGDFFTFFHDTTLTLVDSSPIDISVTTDEVNTLRYAVPFSDTLMVFSDRVQFKLSSGPVLAHDTVRVDVSTRFEADLTAKPRGSSRFVFFATKSGEWGGLREYYVSGDVETNDAEDITTHIPKYIKGGVKKIVTSATEDMVLVLGDDDPTKVYVYNYFWANNEKKQSAWHQWDMAGNVLDAFFINSKIVLTIDREGSISSETIELSTDPASQDTSYQSSLHLDRRVKVYATTPVPYTSSTVVYYTVDGQEVTDTAAYFTTNPTAFLYAGEPYTFSYTFGKFMLRQDNEPLNPSFLKMKDITLDYHNAATFDVHVAPNDRGGGGDRPVRTKTLTQPIGSGLNLLNKVTIGSGRLRTGVWNEASSVRIWITNDTPFPSTFQAAEWRATYNKHAKRV